jgi:hypothetical protein
MATSGGQQVVFEPIANTYIQLVHTCFDLRSAAELGGGGSLVALINSVSVRT